MQIRITTRELRIAFALACALSIALVAMTAYTNHYWMHSGGPWRQTSFANKLLTFMDLGREDNVASWSSSMLLASIGCAALLCLACDGIAGQRDRLRFGWAVIALGFAALSFDELGSAHERLSLPEGYVGMILWYGPVMAALPAYMLAFGFSRMRSDPVAFGLIALGCACLASIPLQEYFEIEMRRGSTRPILELLLEEGTELAGMLAFFAAFLRYGMARIGREPLIIRIDQWVFRFAWIGVFAAGLAAREIVSDALVPDALSGNPRNWFPACAAFLVAMLAWFTPNAASEGHRLSHAICAAVFLCLSLIVGTQIGAVDDRLNRLLGNTDNVRTAVTLLSLLVGLWIAASASYARDYARLAGNRIRIMNPTAARRHRPSNRIQK